MALGEGGVDAGRLRIAPAGDGVVTAWTIGGPTGKQSTGNAVTRLILVDVLDLPEAGVQATPVGYDLGAGCLFITLPDSVRQPAAGSPPTKPADSPAYRGVAATKGLGPGVGRPTRSVAA